MFDGKFVATLVVLIAALFAIMKFGDKKSLSKESFLPGKMTYRADTVVSATENGVKKGSFYTVPGTYQANLPPRFLNADVGSNIRYNVPSQDNMAVPCDPLTFGNMARENYTRENYCGGCGRGCGAADCLKGGASKSYQGGAPLMESDYTNGNYKQVLDSIEQYPEVTDLIPIGNMTTVNPLGEEQTYTVDRTMIYANRNSRLRSQGCMIRGDLPIKSIPSGGDVMFRPSVNANIDLQTGALAVIGGYDNSTGQAMAELIATTSNESTIAGVNMTAMKNVSTASSLADVHVTAFP